MFRGLVVDNEIGNTLNEEKILTNNTPNRLLGGAQGRGQNAMT